MNEKTKPAANSIQDFPGGTNLVLIIFSQKLNENEEMFTRGRRSLRSLDPPLNVFSLSNTHKEIIVSFIFWSFENILFWLPTTYVVRGKVMFSQMCVILYMGRGVGVGMGRGQYGLQYLPTASEGWGKVMFSVCSQRGEGVPQGTYPPGQGRYPSPDQIRIGGTPRYPPPAKVCTPTHQVRTGRKGVPQHTYPPSQVRTGGTPRYLPPGQGRNPPLG